MGKCVERACWGRAPLLSTGSGAFFNQLTLGSRMGLLHNTANP